MAYIRVSIRGCHSKHIAANLQSFINLLEVVAATREHWGSLVTSNVHRDETSRGSWREVIVVGFYRYLQEKTETSC